MFPTGTIVTTITTDRIRTAEAVRRANFATGAEPAAPRRVRRAGRLATRRAILGLRRYARWYARVNEWPAEPRTAAH
jgi:hypothetical protein